MKLIIKYLKLFFVIFSIDRSKIWVISYESYNFSISNMLTQIQALLIFPVYSLFSAGQAYIGLYCWGVVNIW